jgi:hypothetical protein
MGDKKLLSALYLTIGVVMIIGAFFLLNSISSITGFAVAGDSNIPLDLTETILGATIIFITIILIIFINKIK